MRLYEKAKRYGIWNPSDLDFSQDAKEWAQLSPEERDILLRLSAQFQAGEEAVTVDLLPLIRVMAREGRLEEEMFLTTFLFEEAKHTDFFSRFLDEVAYKEVAALNGCLGHYHDENYRQLFYEALPKHLRGLENDPSPAAQIRASVTYNMVVEGMLAETGYHAFFTVLDQRQMMPAMRQGITYLKQDESRHIAYGIYLLSRLVAADDSLWAVLEETMNSLVSLPIGIVSEIFAAYDVAPFGLKEEDFIEYAMDQFEKRFTRLEKARGASLEEIMAITQKVIDENDG